MTLDVEPAPLPPIIESFKDGTNYHGNVNGYFAQFVEGRRWREVTLWTHAETGCRWVDPLGGRVTPGPVAWVSIPK
jgi:hypothetical protein